MDDIKAKNDKQFIYNTCIDSFTRFFGGQVWHDRTEAEILRWSADIIEAIKALDWPKLIKVADASIHDPAFRSFWLRGLFDMMDEDPKAFYNFEQPEYWRSYTVKELEERRKAEEDDFEIEL